MADTTTRIPTDAEIVALAYDCSALPETITDAALLVFARAVLAKWGAPAPAQDDSLTAAYMAGAHDAEKAARKRLEGKP